MSPPIAPVAPPAHRPDTLGADLAAIARRYPPAAGARRLAALEKEGTQVIARPVPPAPPAAPSVASGRVFAAYPDRGLVAVTIPGCGFTLVELPADADVRAGDELGLPEAAGSGPAEVANRRSGERMLGRVRARGLTSDRLPPPRPI